VSPESRIANRGSALVASIVVALLFLSMILWYAEWSRMLSRAEVSRMMAHNAMNYADDGINDALVRLKSPALRQWLDMGTTAAYSIDKPSGRVDISLDRRSPDNNLVDLYATGYYYLPNGNYQDKLTGRPAQRTVINAKFHITNVDQYLLAVPSQLPVSYGTNASAGMIYASNLQFLPCLGGPCGPATQLAAAYYHQSVTPSSAPVFVQFTANPPNAQRVNYPMNFASLDPEMRNFYQAQAGGPLPASFAGIIGAPGSSHVYFVDGDLDIAAGSSLVVNGVYVIYATGIVRIHNNILLDHAGCWTGILSEKEIHLASDAPNNLTLNGTFISNGIFQGDPLPGNLPRSNVNLAINGGIVSLVRIDIAGIWRGNRTYTYQTANTPDFPLPNLTEKLEYKILSGKYQ
jgi:hypothetical protein